MKTKDITAALEQWAPKAYQENYDNCGLLVGDLEQEVTGVIITLDVTEQVISEAVEAGCNLIIAHHPLIFKGLKRITGSHWVERCVTQAIKKDVAIYAIHTNLDNVRTGVNHKIAEKLGLEGLKILSPKADTLLKLVSFVPVDHKEAVLQALYEAGAGQIGEYDHCSFQLQGVGTFRPSDKANPVIGSGNVDEEVNETRLEVIIESHLQGRILSALRSSHPYEEVAYYLHPLINTNQEVGSGMTGKLSKPMEASDFLDYLKKSMGLNTLKYTELCKKEVRTVAICGGAGSFLLSKAISNGADVFITSDVKYHEFFEADSKIIFIDIGHYESEVFTKELIHDFLTQKFANIAFHLSRVVTNPINYR